MFFMLEKKEIYPVNASKHNSNREKGFCFSNSK